MMSSEYESIENYMQFEMIIKSRVRSALWALSYKTSSFPAHILYKHDVHGCFGDIVPFTCFQPVAASQLPPPLAKRPVWSDKAVAVMWRNVLPRSFGHTLPQRKWKFQQTKWKRTLTFKYASSKKKENDKQNDARVLAPNDSLPSSSKLFFPDTRSAVHSYTEDTNIYINL